MEVFKLSTSSPASLILALHSFGWGGFIVVPGAELVSPEPWVQELGRRLLSCITHPQAQSGGQGGFGIRLT